jgi:hypothetical protein
MIFLAITREGLNEALALAKQDNYPVWCTSDAITESKFNTMNYANLTRFNYSFTLIELEVLVDAIETIKEHHPDEKIWIEGYANEL